jgi:hypothetical protein
LGYFSCDAIAVSTRARVASAVPLGSKHFERATLLRHELAPEVVLGGQGVVGAATEAEIGCYRRPAEGECMDVIELEIGRFAAALAGRVDVGTAPFVSRPDSATGSSRHVPPALARVR